MQWLVGLFGSLRALTDIAIAGMMCNFLYYQYRFDLTPRSISLIRVPLSHALTTGLLTSVFATLYVTVYLAMPLNMIYIAVYFIHGKIYVNSMLAALNSRKSLRALAEENIELRSVDFNIFQDTNLP